MKRTLEQNTRLHTLLALLGMDSDDKADLVSAHTRYRTSSSSEMTQEECGLLIHDLQQVVKATDHRNDTKRKRVIAHLAEAGYTKNGSPNMPLIHDWVLVQKHKKSLNAHTSSELSDLIHAANGVRKHHLKQIRK